MCGIFGYVGARDEAPQLVLAGLKKLEYRGYDSWGIAARQNGQAFRRLLVEKHVGKIGQATTMLPSSHAALGHTRWATHGGVTESNAHPHLDCQGRLAVIHNGIIENHAELRHDLIARGHTFSSQTDTEVVCHMLEDELRRDEVLNDDDSSTLREGDSSSLTDDSSSSGGEVADSRASVATPSSHSRSSPWTHDQRTPEPDAETSAEFSAGIPTGEVLVQALIRVFRKLDGLSAISVLDPQVQ
jgi:predicted glutamine amidotransferase